MKPVDVIPVDLHAPVHVASSEETDICFRSDYWHQQPWYIEQEMRAGPLHIFKLAFSCGTFFAEWRK
jgi:hypothetical protein